MLFKHSIAAFCSASFLDLPDEIKIGAVLRGETVIIPRSNYIFKKNDIIVFIVKKDQLPLVENIFRISAV